MGNSEKAGFERSPVTLQLFQAAAFSLAPALQPRSIVYGEQMQVRRARSIACGECAEQCESTVQSKNEMM
jgi:ferredoxin